MPANTISLDQTITPEPVLESKARLICNNNPSQHRLDHFVERDGTVFAGSHLIIDFWGAKHLDDLERMEQALHEAIDQAGATLLHIHLHHFTSGGGISGVAVLAESHISVHTWPERDYAAFDVFMCGEAEPAQALPVLVMAFRPARMVVAEHLRGVVVDPG